MGSGDWSLIVRTRLAVIITDNSSQSAVQHSSGEWGM